MKRALEEVVLEGLTTTVPFHLKVLNNEKFIRGDISTHFVEEMMADQTPAKPAP
jgi:acetyl-CoA carboxylase biotin carboxylase subunit